MKLIPGTIRETTVRGVKVLVKIIHQKDDGRYLVKSLTTRSNLLRSADDLMEILSGPETGPASESADTPPEVSTEEAREIFAPELAASKSQLEEAKGEPVDLTPYTVTEAKTYPAPVANHITKEPKVKLSDKLKPAVTPPHVIVKALAGTGKTTTLIEGLKRVRGIESTLTPSPQQAAVWDSMALSKGVGSVCFVAFNKSIATELQRRVPAGCDAMTMHSLGLKAVTAAFGRVKIESYRVSNLISELLERDVRELRKNDMVLIQATEKLVGLCKLNLVAGTPEDLEEIAAEFQIEMNGSRAKVFDLVPKVLERSKDVLKDGQIDFNDMVWLPVILNLPMSRYDLLLVDECQDLSKCQQELTLKAGRRLIYCGDENQAIYGFAGADSDSIPNLQARLESTPAGCIVLPLTVTRRCGRKIVEEARRIVPTFEAHESNPEGKILHRVIRDKDYVANTVEQDAQNYMSWVQDGDMCLCRVNAPLVSQCFRFLKAGRKAIIRGRDIGQGLISTVKKLKAANIADLIGKLSDWLHAEVTKENAKRNPSEARIIGIQDRYDCLTCFAESASTVEGVITKIETVFSDDNGTGIILSSIHKAKGLEADNVFLLEPKGATVPHPMAKTASAIRQEMNLRYVGITRAIHTLTYVS